jgi:hypothetical protein
MVLTSIDWPALIAMAMAAQTEAPIIKALELRETYASGNAPARYLCSDGLPAGGMASWQASPMNGHGTGTSASPWRKQPAEEADLRARIW